MPLNVVKGNMYSFCTHTFNIIKGLCPHECSYCYMRKFKQNPIRFDRKELKTGLGKDNFIFLGSSCDMFADAIDNDWIIEALDYCKKFDNRYLLQTKNPKKLFEMRSFLPPNSVVGTTIETNRSYYPEMGYTPPPFVRAKYIGLLGASGKTTFVTMEPVMDFDMDFIVHLISICCPAWVNIGADSQGHKLTEPPKKKVEKLIERLSKFTEVKIKKNLGRLMK